MKTTIAQDYLDTNMSLLKSNIDTFAGSSNADYCEVIRLLEDISSDKRRNIEEIMDDSDAAKDRRNLRHRVSANNKLKLIELITKL